MKPTRRSVIIDYLKIPENEELPNRTLARKIQSEKGGTIDQWRDSIRQVKGQGGGAPIITEFKTNPAEMANKAGVPNPLQYQTYERKTPAKILLLDIETAPIRAYVWGMWKQNVSTSQLISDFFCLTWSAKWLFEDKIYNAKITPAEVKREDDKRILKSIHAMISDADIVIAHNGVKFDMRKLNTRFLYHNIAPPSPYQIIDTLLHSRKQLGQSSNRLDALGEFWGVGRKSKTDFELWSRCMEGDKLAIQEMQDYNDQDVRLLEFVYLKLRPYIKPHPNLGLFIGNNVSCCPSCASTKLTQKGQYHTFVNIYDSFQCDDCGSWMRSRKTVTPLKDNRNLKSGLPR